MNNSMKQLQDFIQMEKSITDIIQQAKKDIVKEIEETEIKDVKKIAENICIVKLSQLQHNIWTPEYYLSHVQAAYVTAALDSVSTASSFVKKIKTMIDNRYVKIGQNIHYLNDTTIGILSKHYNSFNID